MGERTPTPWRVSPDSTLPFYIAAPDRGMVAFVGRVPAPIQTGRCISEDEANAAYIVKCVNAHAGLVKVLEECRTSFCGYAITNSDQYPDALANFWKEIKRVDGIARAALASLSEGK